MLLRGRGPADQQRDAEIAPSHLLRHDDHLVERWRDQAGQPHHVGAQLDCRVEDFLGRDHDPEVVDLVVVAGEHNADDVLADVVDVAFDRGEHELAAHAAVAHRVLLGLHEWFQVGDGSLHRARALDDLRQEHLAGAEQVADHLHPVHQRALDDQQRLAVFDASLFRVLLYVFDLAVEDCVLEALLDRAFAPGKIDLALRPGAGHGLRKLDQSFCRVGPPVEDDILDELEQILGDVLVDHQLTRVDDAHVQPRPDRVVEKRGMDRLAHAVVAAEREGEVGDATGDVDPGEALLDLPRRVDEILRVGGVLLDAGGDGEDVGVEDDVLGLEAGLFGQELVGAAGDLHLAFERVCLADLVECHHDGGRAVPAYQARLVQERLLTALQADRVGHALALQAFEARLEDRHLGAVDHHGDPGDLGLGREQVEVADHRRLRVEQVGVHIDVEQVGAATDLIERHLDRAREVAALDQPPEADRSGDVGPLTDHDEARVGTDLKRLQAAEPRAGLAVGQLPPGHLGDCFADLADVLRPRAAAPAGGVQEARLGELLEQPARGRRLLVVAAEGVGQAGVRVADDIDRRDARHCLDVGPHLRRAQRAVHACREGSRVLDRSPECFDGLPGEVAAAPVDDRHRHEERKLRRDFHHCGYRRLRIERVEHRLDQQDVGAALLETACCLRVSVAELVERNLAVRRVVDARRKRKRHVGGAEGPGHESVLVMVGGGAREPGAFQVHFVDVLFESVVGLRHARRGEGVGGDDVGAGLEVFAMHLRDELRLRQAEDVAVVAQRLGVIAEPLAAKLLVGETFVLQHHAHRAVEDYDPLLKKLIETVANRCRQAHGDQ